LEEDASMALRLLDISRKYTPVSIHPTDPALSTYTEEDLLKMTHELAEGLSEIEIQKEVEDVEDLLEEVVNSVVSKSGGGKKKHKKKKKHTRRRKSANDPFLLPEESISTVGHPNDEEEEKEEGEEIVAPLSLLFRAHLAVTQTTHAVWQTVSRPPGVDSCFSTLRSHSSTLATICTGASFIPPLAPFATPMAAFCGFTAAGAAVADGTVRTIDHIRGAHPISAGNARRISSGIISSTAPQISGIGISGTVMSKILSIPNYIKTVKSIPSHVEKARETAREISFLMRHGI